MYWQDDLDIQVAVKEALDVSEGDGPTFLNQLNSRGCMIIEIPAYIDQATVYAIEVPRRGWMNPMTGNVYQTTDSISGMETQAEARKALDNARAKWIALGCPDIAKTLRIASRTVSVTRTEFTPLGES